VGFLFEYLAVFVLVAAHGVPPDRLLVTLFVDYLETLLLLILCYFADDDAGVF